MIEFPADRIEFEEDLHSEEDQLGRSQFASQLASRLATFSPEEAFVVGIFGRWGIGKTTLLKYIEKELEKKTQENERRWKEERTHSAWRKPTEPRYFTFRFEPWLFSERRDLIVAFFETLGSHIEAVGKRQSRKRIAAKLKKYGQLLKPTISTLGLPTELTTILSMFSFFGGGDSNELLELKKDIKREIRNRHIRLVVFIDDVDRLVPTEVMAILRMLKEVADFPNTIFLLACDDEYVRNAIEQVHGPGTGDYLEKIVQVIFRVPEAEESVLRDILRNKVWKLLKIDEDDHAARRRFAHYWESGVSSCYRDLRAVKRVVNSLVFSAGLLEGEVDRVELWVIETLRVFDEKFYSFVREEGANYLDYSEPGADSFPQPEEGVLERIETQYGSAQRDIFSTLFLNAFVGTDLDSHIVRMMDKTSQSIQKWAYFPRYFACSVGDSFVSEREFMSLTHDVQNASDEAEARAIAEDYVREESDKAADLGRLIIASLKRHGVIRSSQYAGGFVYGWAAYIDQAREHRSGPSITYSVWEEWFRAAFALSAGSTNPHVKRLLGYYKGHDELLTALNYLAALRFEMPSSEDDHDALKTEVYRLLDSVSEEEATELAGQLNSRLLFQRCATFIDETYIVSALKSGKSILPARLFISSLASKVAMSLPAHQYAAHGSDANLPPTDWILSLPEDLRQRLASGLNAIDRSRASSSECEILDHLNISLLSNRISQ